MKEKYVKLSDLVPYEKNPRYTDVIVDRWEEFAGRKATLKRDAS